MIPRGLNPQRDFSAGEVMDMAERRDDTDIIRNGCKRLLNSEIIQTGSAKRRPGLKRKRAGRDVIAKITSVPGTTFDVQFRNGEMYFDNNETGTRQVVGSCPWATADLFNLSWAEINKQIFVAGPGLRTQVFTYDEDTGDWTRADFAFISGLNGEQRMPFYRFAETGVTILLDGAREKGSTVTFTFSAPIVKAGHVGTYLRYGNAQCLITDKLSATKVRATVKETLPPTHRLTLMVTDKPDGFRIGDVVEGTVSFAKGQVVALTTAGPPYLVDVFLFDKMARFYDGEFLVGPTGRVQLDFDSVEIGPLPVTLWDEQFIEDFRGWPGSVSFDRNRLIFADFEQLPQAFVESAIGLHTDFFVGPDAADAIFEKVPGNERVLYVVGGADQFALTDKSIYYIPISESSPLAPGSVQCTVIGGGGCSKVNPVLTNSGVVFVAGDGKRIMAIRPIGQDKRPYALDDTSRYHAHLITGPVSLATKPSGFSTRAELLVIVNADGSAVMGIYTGDRDWIGYMPWLTEGLFKSVAADEDELIFAVERTLSTGGTVQQIESALPDVPLDGAINGSDAVSENKIEIENEINPVMATILQTLELDGQELVTSEESFNVYAGATVWVWRDGASYGQTTLAADGSVADPDIPVDELTWIGFKYDFELTPFTWNFEGGESKGQRMRRRKINKWAVSVQDTQEFFVDGVARGGYVIGDDTALPQPRRSNTFTGRKSGRSYKPELPFKQDWPGDITITEVAMEVTA